MVCTCRSNPSLFFKGFTNLFLLVSRRSEVRGRLDFALPTVQCMLGLVDHLVELKAERRNRKKSSRERVNSLDSLEMLGIAAKIVEAMDYGNDLKHFLLQEV